MRTQKTNKTNNRALTPTTNLCHQSTQRAGFWTVGVPWHCAATDSHLYNYSDFIYLFIFDVLVTTNISLRASKQLPDTMKINIIGAYKEGEE